MSNMPSPEFRIPESLPRIDPRVALAPLALPFLMACAPQENPIVAAPAAAEQSAAPSSIPSGQPEIVIHETPPTTFGGGESQSAPITPKSEPSQIPGQLDSVLASINGLTSPLNPKATPETFNLGKQQIELNMKAANEALAKNDVNAAQEALGKAQAAVVSIGDPAQSIFLSPDVKTKVDPKDKYVGKTRLDPRLTDQFTGIVGVRVAIDPTY